MKEISIFGYGTTSKPLVEWLNKNGVRCNIFDDSFTTEKQQGQNTLLPPSAFNPLESSIEFISPGIPPTHPFFSKALHKIGEYDFITNLLEEHNKHPLIVWISGTNGKTTTTQMLSFLLESKGAKSGGNIGTPLIELFCLDAPLWILETSSFAMHYANKAVPMLYLLLPIQEDHISWHSSFQAYVDDKLKVLGRMGEDTYAVLPAELKHHKYVKTFNGRAIFYADSSNLATFLGIGMGDIVFKEPFLQDGLLALCGAKILYQQCDIARLNQFHIGAHRLEEFRDSKGWFWVDDSKGTNTDATMQAIKRYSDKWLYIILGGDDKGADCRAIFDFMGANLGQRVHIFTIGSNEQKLLSLAKDYRLKATACGNLQAAIESIRLQIQLDKVSNQDFIGLLSPAAASLDQFQSYKQRGDLFKKYVLEG